MNRVASIQTNEGVMISLSKTLMIAAGVFAMSASAASAAVVCNSSGDCWKVRGRPTYAPDLGLRIYADNWKWKKGENYRWRSVGRGRGYYRDGVWITIR